MKVRELIDARQLPELVTHDERRVHVAAYRELHFLAVRREAKCELSKSEARERLALELAGRQTADSRHLYSRRPTDRRSAAANRASEAA
jgi:hypothetical protein